MSRAPRFDNAAPGSAGAKHKPWHIPVQIDITIASAASPISQIALMLGYSENSAFVHGFTRLAGVSPSEYRNR